MGKFHQFLTECLRHDNGWVLSFHILFMKKTGVATCIYMFLMINTQLWNMYSQTSVA